MTQKHFYQYIVATVENEEVKGIAQAWLDRDSAKSAKKHEEDNKLFSAILEVLGSVTNPVTASEIGAEIGVSTAKAASLLRVMRTEGDVKAIEEVKGNKVARTYTLA